MKKILLFTLLIPFFNQSEAQFTLTNSSTTSICELRASSTPWPLDLQRIIKQRDTSYVLSFRDQQYSNVVSMSTLKFRDKGQLKYFQQALSSLAQLESGTIANFKDYTIKRADVKKDVVVGKKEVKKDEVWYLLTCEDGTVTNFQQSEANKMISAIQPI